MKIRNIIIFLVVIVLLVILNENRIYLDNYPTDVDTGNMSSEQIDVMYNIITSNEHILCHNLSQDELDEVIDYLGLYFGTCFMHWNIALWRPGFAEINLDLLEKLKSHKYELDCKIDKAISNMQEGSDKFKLFQISNHIANSLIYSLDGPSVEPYYTTGSCMTYSILFYKMSRRLNIESFVCYGDVSNGLRTAPHAWNMVVLGDRKYFYDLTWYDTPLRLPLYICNSTGWGRDYILNKKLSNN